MVILAAVSSVLSGVVAFVLLRRLGSAAREARARLQSAKAPDDLPERVLRLLRTGIDSGLLAGAGPGGLSEVEVRAREPHDPYRNVAGLVDWLAKEASGKGYAEVSGIIKGVYQLGHTLRSPEEEIRRGLEPLLARVKATSVGGSPIGRVECIRPGAILDPGAMAPLNYGARVTQPLGVLVYDVSGKVLGKAKVLCG
jgi:hypothetical protein